MPASLLWDVSIVPNVLHELWVLMASCHSLVFIWNKEDSWTLEAVQHDRGQRPQLHGHSDTKYKFCEI